MALPPELGSAGLPEALVSHLLACDAAGADGRLLTALRRDPEPTLRSLKALVAAASAATGLGADGLMARTGLATADARGRRADGAVAELRAAVLLSRLGFKRITPLGPDDTRRRADLTAEREGELWAVDARCASRDLLPEGSFRRGPDGRPLPYPTLFDYLVHCRAEKKEQLERTMRDERCTRSAVAVALEGGASGDRMRQEAARAWVAAGAPPDFRFALMPGLLDAASPDDCLVPAP